jgi:energy-coupling factor transport system ATP-binding protein
MTALVEARQFSMQYPYTARPTLQHLSCTLRQGERVLLLGASGSGKSSFCLCLNGLIPHSIEADIDGLLSVCGFDTRRTEPACLARHIGMVFQDPESQFCTLTVEDEVAFGLENLCLSRADIANRIDQALRWIGLEAHRHTRLDRLSGGQKQRVMLAACLAMDPKILVLDEATSHLDPAGARQFLRLIHRFAQTEAERTLLVVEHQLDMLIESIHRVWVLDEEGTLRHDAPPRPLFTQYGSELEQIGVWQPSAISLAHTLHEAGILWTPYPLTIRESLDRLRDCPQAWADATHWARPGADPAPAPDGEPILELNQVTFAYPDGTQALRGIDLAVRRGEVLALVGANGAGKTTLAQLMVGLLRPQQDRVRFLGQDIAGLPLRELAGRCGFVFQNPEHQFVTDRVFDEIAFGLRRQGLSEEMVHTRTEQLLHRLGLTPHTNANPFALSQGQKRRLSVASMLAGDKELLVLDEPTFGQDVRNRQELMAALRRLNREGVTLLLVTHDMDLVWELAQRAAVLADGHLLKVAPVETIFADRALLQQAHLEPAPRATMWTSIQALADGPVQ